jgi:hypothetical protein
MSDQFRKRWIAIAAATAAVLVLGWVLFFREPPLRHVVFAGGAGVGYGGDGGPATKAGFDRPTGLALDAHGNLYIAESDNHVIRRVDPRGIVTTFAGTGKEGFSGDGGPARKARLAGPEGVWVSKTVLLSTIRTIASNCFPTGRSGSFIKNTEADTILHKEGAARGWRWYSL